MCDEDAEHLGSATRQVGTTIGRSMTRIWDATWYHAKALLMLIDVMLRLPERMLGSRKASSVILTLYEKTRFHGTDAIEIIRDHSGPFGIIQEASREGKLGQSAWFQG